MIAYLDASIVLRVVLRQPKPLAEFDEIERAVTSSLLEVECLRTLDRLRLGGELTDSDVSAARAAVLNLLAQTDVLELSPVVLRRAAAPMPTQLTILDAIHLATALVWRESTDEPLTMATHDVALGIAARAHGLPVVGI